MDAAAFLANCSLSKEPIEPLLSLPQAMLAPDKLLPLTPCANQRYYSQIALLVCF